MTVRVIEVRELDWSFDDAPPAWRTTSQIKNYGTAEKVDPTPCYTHDLELVRAEAGHVHGVFPIGVPVTIHVAPWESLGRTNGWASQEWNYYAGPKRDQKVWEVAIALSGKRIPPHPAMTRYLVAHEYGHAVDDWLCHVRGLQPNGLDDEYRKLRNLSKAAYRYGPGRWHSNVGELIANDFRILVAKREREFWPHPGLERPERLPAIRKFWRDAVGDAYRPLEVAA